MGFKLHSEPDAEGTLIGDLHMRDGVLYVNNTPVYEVIAAKAGVLLGGRITGVLEYKFTKLSITTTTSDQTEGKAFHGTPEPAVPPVGLG